MAPDRPIRFVASGIAATATHFLIAYVLIVRFALDPGPANACAFAVATCVSYLGNTYWTFRSRHSPRVLLRFILVVVSGSALSWLVGGAVALLGWAWWIGVAVIAISIPMFTWTAHRKWTYA